MYPYTLTQPFDKMYDKNNCVYHKEGEENMRRNKRILYYILSCVVLASAIFYMDATKTHAAPSNADTYSFDSASGTLTIHTNEGSTLWRKDTKISIRKVQKIVVEDGVTEIGERAFMACYSLTSAALPEGLTTIGVEAFSGCSLLKDVSLPSSVEKIMYEAFYQTGIERVKIPEGVTSITDGAFSGCNNLTQVELPESLLEIEGSAFTLCGALTRIDIPANVTSIGREAFSSCSCLAEITIHRTEPFRLGKNPFDTSVSGFKLNVPAGTADAYKAAWPDYAPYIGGTGPSPTKYEVTVHTDGNGTANATPQQAEKGAEI